MTEVTSQNVSEKDRKLKVWHCISVASLILFSEFVVLPCNNACVFQLKSIVCQLFLQTFRALISRALSLNLSNEIHDL